jgi:hypothetical protein
MAIKINGTTIISDTRVLEAIANTDVTTDTTINSSIKKQANVLRIYNSAGTEVRTLYCAAETAQA